ncbi:MAG TPA: hypothetical protein DCL93_08350 [Faecalibacterium sp.]|nr:hypothetical protein [Faecalibacterium sp.]
MLPRKNSFLVKKSFWKIRRFSKTTKYKIMIPLKMPKATRRAFKIVLWRCTHGCGNYRRICLAKHPAPRPGQP